MNLEQQFEQWEQELSFRERAELALEFIEKTDRAYGTVEQTDGHTATIYLDLLTEFRTFLYEFYMNMENFWDEEEADDVDPEYWVNVDEEDANTTLLEWWNG